MIGESTQKRLLKGLLAGVVAGLVATAAKTFMERIYPPQGHGEPEPEDLLAERLAGHRLDASTRELAGGAIHWGFGAAAGAAYGALAEFYPAATAKEGASFGLALMALTQEGEHAMALAAPPEELSFRERSGDAAGHVLYGVVAERVRSFVRKLL